MDLQCTPSWQNIFKTLVNVFVCIIYLIWKSNLEHSEFGFESHGRENSRAGPFIQEFFSKGAGWGIGSIYLNKAD